MAAPSPPSGPAPRGSPTITQRRTGCLADRTITTGARRGFTRRRAGCLGSRWVKGQLRDRAGIIPCNLGGRHSF